ncbi:hypothetical protein FRC03_006846, partial [Tulasnella sp. 419]
MDPTIDTSAVTFNAIEKLVGAANYKRWQEAMKNALMQKGFWRLVTEEDKEAHYANDAIKKEDFHKQRIQAMGYIYQNVTISIANRLKNLSTAGTATPGGTIPRVPKITTPAELWKKLETDYDKTRAILAFNEFRRVFDT